MRLGHNEEQMSRRPFTSNTGFFNRAASEDNYFCVIHTSLLTSPSHNSDELNHLICNAIWDTARPERSNYSVIVRLGAVVVSHNLNVKE